MILASFVAAALLAVPARPRPSDEPLLPRSTRSSSRSTPSIPPATTRGRRRRWRRACGRPASRAADVQVLDPAAAQGQPGGAAARHRRRAGRCSCWPTSTWWRRGARTGRSIPFTLLEKDGYFYGRGTSDDKAMAAIWIATLIRLRAGGLPARPRHHRGPHRGRGDGARERRALARRDTHRDLIDAELALNEGAARAASRTAATWPTASRPARRSTRASGSR